MNNSFEKRIEVYAHTVEIRYWNIPFTITEDIQQLLEEEGENRAKEMIAKNCYGGELNCVIASEIEIRGWWEII